MLHSNSRQLLDYWRARRTGRRSPERASINPADFPELMPQLFILGRTAPGQFVFRLAGALVADLHGRDLRRLDFTALWGHAERGPVATALEGARRSAEALVLLT